VSFWPQLYPGSFWPKLYLNTSVPLTVRQTGPGSFWPQSQCSTLSLLHLHFFITLCIITFNHGSFLTFKPTQTNTCTTKTSTSLAKSLLPLNTRNLFTTTPPPPPTTTTTWELRLLVFIFHHPYTSLIFYLPCFTPATIGTNMKHHQRHSKLSSCAGEPISGDNAGIPCQYSNTFLHRRNQIELIST